MVSHGTNRRNLNATVEADPTFARADGSELTAADVEALIDIFRLIEDVFDFAEHLFEPFNNSL